MEKKYKKWIIPSVYLFTVGVIIMCILMVTTGINNFMKQSIDYDYGVYGVFDELKPVQGETSALIIKPFISEKVIIGKYFYDYEADKEEQERSLVYYENTYLQNSGIDYISNEGFDVVSILDGEIIEVKADELLGNIVQIKHDNELISIYQSIKDITVKKGDKINQGAIIGTSGTNKVNLDYTNMLHFEIYYKGDLIDPENIYNLNIEDFN